MQEIKQTLVAPSLSSILNAHFSPEVNFKQNIAHLREIESCFFKDLLLLEVNGFSITHYKLRIVIDKETTEIGLCQRRMANRCMHHEKSPGGNVLCTIKLDSQVTDDLLVLSKL